MELDIERDRGEDALVGFADRLAPDLRQAVLQGLAPDSGLYMPEKIPRLPASFWKQWKTCSPAAIAYEIAANLVGSAVPEKVLKEIVEQTVSFDVPLVPVEDMVWALELFHGPTLAFKDFGARFMAGLLGYFVRNEHRQTTILVATSGDTGSAVSSGFHRVEGTRVVVLYPSGKVSDLQEKQFTTLGDNVTALEVKGTFDDCQRMVKLAFQDTDLAARQKITSANSINIARLIPQSFYYFFAAARFADQEEIIFSSSGENFLIPIRQFVKTSEYAHTHGLAPESFVDDVPRAFSDSL